MTSPLEERFKELLPRILDFLSGFFIGVGIIGSVCSFFVARFVFDSAFLALLIGFGVFCVFVFFGIVSKAICILLKHTQSATNNTP